jgi:type II secretory pathway pseudopilin PulG
LIELIVVTVILGLLATVAAPPLRGAMNRYELGRALETIETFDAQARRTARVSREAVDVTIRQDQRGTTLLSSSQAPQHSERVFRLPDTVRITDLRRARQATTGSDLTFRVNDRGRSASYAIALSRGKLTRWLVVLGTSGQLVPVATQEEADALLSP